MFGMAAILEALVGPLFRWVTVPLMAGALLVTSHLLFESYKERLRMQGDVRCDSRWEERIRSEERSAASKEIAAGRVILQAERETANQLRDENEKLTGEMQDLLSDSDGDANCLSGRVLEQLRKGIGSERAKPGKGATARPAPGS